MKIAMKHPIDLSKGLTAPVILAMMWGFDNWTVGPWVYLALHGCYGVMWVLKSWTFPDPGWEVKLPLWKAAFVFFALWLYWLAPLLLISGGAVPPNPLICGCVATMVLGTFLVFGADAQKYFVLKARRGLITDGFFSRTRNPNYLGEMMIYGSLAALSMHWIPWVVCALYWGGVFLPNMLRKDKSMSRYPAWQAYVDQTGLLLPAIWRSSSSASAMRSEISKE